MAALTAFEATLGRFNWQEARRRLTLSFLNEIITGRLREGGGGAGRGGIRPSIVAF